MSTTTSSLLKPLSLHNSSPQRRMSTLPTRRDLLFTTLTSTATLAVTLSQQQLPSKAEDIPLFGLRKSLKKAEKEAEVIVKEGFEAAEKGFEDAEKKVESVEKEVESTVSFGGLAQAGVVVGAEVLGVLIATSVVNGILGPQGQES